MAQVTADQRVSPGGDEYLREWQVVRVQETLRIKRLGIVISNIIITHIFFCDDVNPTNNIV